MIFRRSATLIAVSFCFVLLSRLSFAGIVSRPFKFGEDTLSYTNELVWEYGWDERGHWVAHKRQPAPAYTLHCFVASRTAASFFRNATFDPSKPLVSPAEYRRLIRSVLRAPLRRDSGSRITIPGYTNLRQFSEAFEKTLKQESGGAWHSYFQRGHWRMVFPFSRGHQERTAAQLAMAIRAGKAPLVHLVRFPALTINHACLLFAVNHSGNRTDFQVYDPNNVSEPAHLTFDSETRTFSLPANNYFPGGKVDVYQIWHKLLY